MAKRFTLSPVIGTGSHPDPFRAAVDDVPLTQTASVIPTHPVGHPQQGQPKFNFTFSVVGTASLAGLLAIPNAYVFPDYGLDGRLDGMESGARSGMVQSAEAYDLDGAGLHLALQAANQDSASYRDFLQALGIQFEPSFNINTFDVTEPAL
jgi:hypothetical protein